MLKLVQMWIKLQIRAKIREKGGSGIFQVGYRIPEVSNAT